MPSDEKQYKTIDKFDKILGGLIGLPDVTKTKPTTVVVAESMVGGVMTFIVQTYRQREKGDTIFLQLWDSDGAKRIAIMPEVSDIIARQRDALTTKVRRKIGKEKAAERKARGELPGFMKNPGNGKRKKKRKPSTKRKSRPNQLVVEPGPDSPPTGD